MKNGERVTFTLKGEQLTGITQGCYDEFHAKGLRIVVKLDNNRVFAVPESKLTLKTEEKKANG